MLCSSPAHGFVRANAHPQARPKRSCPTRAETLPTPHNRSTANANGQRTPKCQKAHCRPWPNAPRHRTRPTPKHGRRHAQGQLPDQTQPMQGHRNTATKPQQAAHSPCRRKCFVQKAKMFIFTVGKCAGGLKVVAARAIAVERCSSFKKKIEIK